MAKQKVWTKRCADGSVCRPNVYGPDALKRGGNLEPIGKGDPAFVADENTICDYCLLAKWMNDPMGRYDSCDQLGLGPELYERDDVIQALRRATGE